MREGWEIKRLGEICDFNRGLTYSKKDEVEYSTNIVLRSNNIDLNSNTLNFGELKYINSQIKVPLNKRVSKGSLLICTANGSKSHLGKVALIDDEYNYAFGGFMGLIKPRECVESKFLYYLMISDSYRTFISELSDGANINNLKYSQLEEFTVPLPRKLEQQRIVAVLDETFSAIDKAKANVERNLQNAEALYEGELNALLWNHSEDWERKKLGEICTLYQGLAINAKTKHALVEKSELPLLRIKDLKNGTFEQFVDPNNFPKNALVNEDDLIYTRTGSLGLVFRGFKGVLHNNSFKVVPSCALMKDYLFIWLKSPIFFKRVMAVAGRAAQPDITHSLFKQQIITFPKDITKQQSIVERLNNISENTNKLITAYQKKLNDLEELKKSILQKTFNGELQTTKEAETALMA